MVFKQVTGLLRTTRRVTALGVILGLAYLWSQFSGGGLVPLADSSSQSSPVSSDATETPVEEPDSGRARIVPVQLPADTNGTGADRVARFVAETGVVRVLIDERSFQVAIREDERWTLVPAALEEILDLVRTAPGDSNGIRVHIRRRETARASAEDALLRALQQQGVGADAIYVASELVP